MPERSGGCNQPLLAVCLMLLMLVPLASAAGGGLTMSSTSLVVTGHDEIGVGDVNLSVDVDADVIASGHLHAQLLASDASVLFDENRSIARTAGQVAVEMFNISDVPLGQHEFTLTLWGDTGSVAGDDVISMTGVLRRLAPATPQFDGVGPSEWSVTPLDGTSLAPSSNETLRDGDHARIQVPLTNAGDAAWNGSIHWRVDEGTWVEVEVNLSGGADTFVPLEFGPLSEGSAELAVEILGTFLSASKVLAIGPPPLAGLDLGATSSVAEPGLGENVEWTLNLTNFGELAWNGTVVCTDPAEIELSNFSFDLNASASHLWEVLFPTRPGTFSCAAVGEARLHDGSVTQFDHLYDLEAGHMVAAASGGLAIDGGPFHVGDEIPLSLLVNNAGDLRGNAALQVRVTSPSGSTGWVLGESRSLEVGSSRALTHDYTPSASGGHLVEWRLVSADAMVDANLSGSTQVQVAPPQSLALDLGTNTWALADGLSSEILIELSDGPLRSATLEIGYTDIEGEHLLLSTEVSITPGRRALDFDLGEPGDGAAAVQLFGRLTPLNWEAAEDAEFTASLSRPAPVLLVHIESPEPASPEAGKNVNMRFSLSNTGDAASLTGTLQLVDTRSHAVIWTGPAPEVSAGATEEVRAQIVWPVGATVDLRLDWQTGEGDAEALRSFASTQGQTSDQSFEFDTMAIVYGVLAGFAIALVTRVISHARAGQPLMKKRAAKPKTKAAAVSSEEKVEVACPTCDQRLRVPATYSGKARCPSCSTQFPVEAAALPEPVEEKELEEEEVEEEVDDEIQQAVEAVATEPTATSRTDVLQCPECDQKLKVPIDRRPCKARCKGCEVIFRAEYG